MSSELGTAKLQGVIRRRTLAIVTTIVGATMLAAAIIWAIDPGYKAGAIIRVAEAQPAKEYVAPTVTERAGERLKSLRLAVMGRPILVEAAKQLHVFAAYPGKSADEVIDDMRSRMDVKVEGDDTFLLTYTDSDPRRAQAVCNRVAQLFMQHHVDMREKMASATTQALKGEAESLRPQLAEAEKQVRDFKLAHYGSLPEQIEGNLRTLDQTTMEINIQSTNLDMDQERRRTLLASAMSSLRHHEESLAAQLYDARTKYTNDNPEVKRIQSEYEKIKAERITDEKDLNSKARRSNPELGALEGEIARTKAMVAGLRDRQAQMRARVDATAKNGQSLAMLTTNYDSLKDKYTAVMSRLRDSQLAEGMEKGLAAMRFEMIEEASLPQHATSPNRPLLGAGALLLALALGLGVGFALDAKDRSIRDPEQFREMFDLPILATIPRVDHTTGPKAEA